MIPIILITIRGKKTYRTIIITVCNYIYSIPCTKEDEVDNKNRDGSTNNSIYEMNRKNKIMAKKIMAHYIRE